MQHYGCATRLLDWTQSPLIAAFFAVGLAPGGGDARLYALEPATLNNIADPEQGYRVADPNIDSAGLFRTAFNRSEPAPAVAIAVACRESDVRMAVQQSAFTIHGATEPLDEHPRRSEFLRSFVIPAAQRYEVARDALVLGMERHHLFPDLDNLGRYVNQHHGYGS